MKVRLAAVYSVRKKIEKNWIRQLAWAEQEVDAGVVRFVTDRAEGFEVTSGALPMPIRILKSPPLQMPAPEDAAVLRCANAAVVDEVLDASEGTWLQHPSLHPDDRPLNNAAATVSTYRFVSVEHAGTLTKRQHTWPLSDFFDENPPVITFADGSYLEGNLLVALPDIYAPYDRERIDVWDWSDVNIKKEAQGATRERDSIQFKVIEDLKATGGYDIIYDDDGSGESADVVTIKVTEDEARATIAVDFYHCKYSQESSAGARVGDLYEVCGQAQKSISWLLNQLRNTELFVHLLRRDPKIRKGKELSRYQTGDRDTLQSIRNRSRMAALKLRVFIVQPGLSREKATPEQLSLLSVTENFLLETYNVPFGVIGSA